MALYRSLAPIYGELFPMPRASLAFLEALRAGSRLSAPRSGESRPRALDAGCATGELVLALAERGWEAVGIEPEPAMVELARAAAERRGFGAAGGRVAAEALPAAAPSAGGRGSARFLVGDMLDAESLAGPGPFDLVLCLGNTLPHLSPEGVRRFLGVARSLLAPSTYLVLQLLNYARGDVGLGFAFPDIEARGLRFRRRYEAGPEGKIRFVTELSGGGAGPGPDDEVGQVAAGDGAAGEGTARAEETPRSELLLEPIEPVWLCRALDEAGFAAPELYSGWEGGRFETGRDLYLVAVASPRG